MPLTTGTRLGSYEIVTAIGAGGMGEVYRARDTKLGRDVAIKILPTTFAHDADRVARFRREAQLLAALNHPNIAAIYGFEEADGSQFLVLELIEGETLAHTLAPGAALSVADALAIARQIADALQAAHEKGIIHRDLKPANVALTADGQVKVLDFGLAKAMEPASGATGPHAGPGDVTHSPTLTFGATQAGVILGTAAYMSPEQAKGRAADKRSDIWAFGCVLYEMLTGTRAFQGEDVSDTLATVLKSDPDWRVLPPNLPAAIGALIRRCLEKDRKQRIADIAVALFVMNDGAGVASTAATAAAPAGGASQRRLATTAMATLVGGAVISATVTWAVMRSGPTPPRPVTRFQVALGPNDSFSTPTTRHLVAMSPDGTRLVYSANTRLYMRALDQLEANPIRGTELGGGNFGRTPFFSPDGQWIGFWQDGQLKKVSVNGGAPVTLCKAPNPLGASWSDDGTIVFGQGRQGISRVSAAGGTPEVIVRDPKGVAHGPQMLPGGRAVLFTLNTGSGSWDDAQIVAQTLDTGKRQVLVQGGTDARYLPTGHLVYVTGGTLLAVPFDAAALKVTAGPVPLVENVSQAAPANSGAAHFAISRNGSLAYVPGGAGLLVPRTLVWVDRQGHEATIKAPVRQYTYPRLSPDGTRVAIDIRDRERDIWIWDLGRETLSRLTTDPTLDRYPAWTPDGRHLLFSSDRAGPANIFWQAADGTGGLERLTKDTSSQWVTGISPDGRGVIFDQVAASSDVMMAALDKDHRVQPLVQTPFGERNGEISPDGRWLSYESNDTGQAEIYVRPFPDVNSGRWQISTGGGTRALWARGGQELFYAAPTGAIMSVRIERGTTWKAGTPTKLFEGRYYFGEGTSIWGRTYDVSPDGRRFLMVKPGGDTGQTRAPASLIVVQNWFEELKARVAQK